jgi:hypothetical protein
MGPKERNLSPGVDSMRSFRVLYQGLLARSEGTRGAYELVGHKVNINVRECLARDQPYRDTEHVAISNAVGKCVYGRKSTVFRNILELARPTRRVEDDSLSPVGENRLVEWHGEVRDRGEGEAGSLFLCPT